MANNTGNKRIPVKWVRDLAKKAYDKKEFCYICATCNELELHHLYSITLLLDEWAEKNNYDISTDEGILAVREEFIEAYKKEIYDDVFTLCNRHHVKLHGIYGKKPAKHTAPKQARWIELQKQKQNSGDIEVTNTAYKSIFSAFTK